MKEIINLRSSLKDPIKDGEFKLRKECEEKKPKLFVSVEESKSIETTTKIQNCYTLLHIK